MLLDSAIIIATGYSAADRARSGFRISRQVPARRNMRTGKAGSLRSICCIKYAWAVDVIYAFKHVIKTSTCIYCVATCTVLYMYIATINIIRISAAETMSSSRDHTPILHKPYMVPFKKRPWHKDKMFYFNLIRRSLAEFLGTSLFVFTAVSALSNMSRDSEGRDYDPSSVAVTAGLAQGLAYGALVAAMSHVR